MKRLFDLFICCILFIPALIACLVVAVIVFIVDGESPIFSQLRVGKKERQFKIYKLRTMKTNTGDVGTHEVKSSSITTVGRFVRKTKLDELPQIWNVLLGQMSFVGPRPCLPIQNDLINERRDRDVFSVLPGITGLAQLSKIDMSTPKELAVCDAKYIATQNMRLDLFLFLHTAMGKGYGDDARVEDSIDTQNDN